MKIQIDDDILDATEEQMAALVAVQDNREYPIVQFPNEELTPEEEPTEETPTE